MNEELVFAQHLKDLILLAKDQGNMVSEEQLRDAFPELELSEEKFGLIQDYLKEHKIGIGTPVDPFEYISSDEKNYLDEYLKELKDLPDYSEGEKEGISLAAMAGDITAQKQLMEIYLKQVPDLAKLYAGQGVLMEDLIGEGNVAIATGVTMLSCLEKADEVDGLIVQMVMDAMEEAVAEAGGTKDTSEKIAERLNDVLEQAKELADSFGRNVTPEELCMETEYTLEEIYEAIELSGDQIEYIEVKKS